MQIMATSVYTGILCRAGAIIVEHSCHFPLSKHVIRFHELPAKTMQRFLR